MSLLEFSNYGKADIGSVRKYIESLEPVEDSVEIPGVNADAIVLHEKDQCFPGIINTKHDQWIRPVTEELDGVLNEVDHDFPDTGRVNV